MCNCPRRRICCLALWQSKDKFLSVCRCYVQEEEPVAHMDPVWEALATEQREDDVQCYPMAKIKELSLRVERLEREMEVEE